MEFLALVLLPALMLYASAVLLVRLWLSNAWTVIPELELLVLVISIRSVFFLQQMWESNTIAAWLTPAVMFLAAEESLRQSAILADDSSRSWRYRWCIAIGFTAGAVAYLLHPSAIRGSLQIAICAMLGASLAHAVVWGWSCFTDRAALARQALLLVFTAAAVISSRDSGDWWVSTLATEILQLACLIAFQWFIPNILRITRSETPSTSFTSFSSLRSSSSSLIRVSR